MRKVNLVLVGAVIGASARGRRPDTRMFSGVPARAAVSDTYRSLNLFGDVFEKVRSDYVEKPDDQKLVESAINGMLTSLDPHSSYMDAKSFRDMQVQTRGEFGGLGIEVTQEDGIVKVVTPIDDTPASRAGVLAGDLIVGDRRRERPGHDAEPGRRQDARRGQHHRDADASRAAPRRTSWTSSSPARSSRSSRCARTRKATTSATSASPSSTNRPMTA